MNDGRPNVTLAMLLSGTGRSLENLLQKISQGTLRARIAVVLSSKPDVRGLEIAAAAGIPNITVRRLDYPSDETYSEAVYTTLAPYRPDLIVLAGFLRKLIVPPSLEGRILNIHPALLPEMSAFAAGRGFYGERVHAAVLASGATESGCTVHIVDNGFDSGPVIQRAVVPVLPDDTPATLGARVFAAECDLYPDAINRYVADHPELFARDDGPTPSFRACRGISAQPSTKQRDSSTSSE